MLLGELSQWGAGYAIADRLGSAGGPGAYFPYGENIGNGPMEPGTESFATYYEDWYGQDYADQRYYNSMAGRFLTPDPGGIRTADPRNPTSWNRYAYVNGDPVNFSDRQGLMAESAAIGKPVIPNFAPVPVPPNPNPDPPSDPAPPAQPIHPQPKPPSYCNNTRVVNFIQSHYDDALNIAAGLGVPVEFVLAVSEDESAYGSSPIARQAQNYFGIWAGGANSTGTYTTSRGTNVSSYVGTYDPYLASGTDFMLSELGNADAVDTWDADQFFAAIHDKFALGMSVHQYVDKMIQIVNMTELRLTKCPWNGQ